MDSKRIKLVLISAFTILSFILFSQNTNAQLNNSSLSIGYSPIAVYLTLKPGEVKTDELVFWNLAPVETEYFSYIKGFKQIQEIPGTSRILTDQEEKDAPYSASSWIKVDKQSLKLYSNEYTKLKYTITVPKDVASGEYNAQVFLLSESQKKKIETSSAAFADLGAGPVFLVRVGQISEKAQVEYFRTDKPFYEYTPTIFETMYVNKGNSHIKPTGDIVIVNFLGQEVDRITFNQNLQGLLRGTSAIYKDRWNMDNYFTKNGKLAIGPLKATLYSTYRSENPGFATLTATTSYWVLPWKIILAIVVIFTILVKVFKKIMNKENKVIEKDNSEEYKKYWAKK